MHPFTRLLALGLGRDGTAVTARGPVRPESFLPGSSRIRLAVLATMVDVVAGQTPNGPDLPATGSTMDLRCVLLGPPPATGHVHLRCQPLRVGRRAVVAETELFAAEPGPSDAPFARAVSTYVAWDTGGGSATGPPPVEPVAGGSFDAYLGARCQDAHTLVLDRSDRLTNGPTGTIHGGAQALLAELAAERVVGGPAAGAGDRRVVATDLDIRYVDRLRIGPLVASARALTAANQAPLAVVELRDAGDDDRLVSQATVTFGYL